ncbi:NADP-dependent oxidoreductase [Novosphingobium sp.]|uniref:NADP-dependent oxidoreductase n=1 Tax=Novosphingobium sp. TaxID=1874826 RepID=UPI0038BB6675
MNNTKWVLKARPSGGVAATDLELVDDAIRSPGQGEILVRNIYLSLDPTNRLWMSDRDQYLAPVGLGSVMRGITVGVVEQSRSERFASGDVVSLAEGGWQAFSTVSEKMATRILRLDGVPLSAYLSVLGPTGYTAYFGIEDICRPMAGEVVVVSAAAGAVGSVAGQLAKLRGARVFGVAGGAAKCGWLLDELGFDAAINYRSEAVGERLDTLCAAGIDVNFENVGGPIMEAVFSRMRENGRMALCGMISAYNNDGPMAGPSDFGRILMKRLLVRGFVVIDYVRRFKEAQAELSRLVAEGRLVWKDHVVDGLGSAVSALDILFSGANNGKLIVRVSDG